MCGRFSLYAQPSVLADLFKTDEFKTTGFETVGEPELFPRYNIAPTQPILVLRNHPMSRTREWAFAKWGLVPSWSKDPKIGVRMINARSETARDKPSFRAAFKRRRCLVPVDGFYEWKRQGKAKQPYYITMSDKQPFAVAGLWEHWEGADGSILDSCTLLTTEPNELMETLHNRMPVIIAREDYEMWLDSKEDANYLSFLQHLLRPYPSAEMEAVPVSSYVSNARNEGVECIQPIEL